MSAGVGALLRAYWLSKQRDGGLPHRRDIDPGEIRGLLPDLALVELLDDDLTFRFRVAGTSIEKRLGRPVTNRTFDGAESDGRYGELVTVLSQALETGDSVESRIAYFGDEAVYEAIEITALPLLKGDGDRSMALMTMEFVVSAGTGYGSSMKYLHC